MVRSSDPVDAARLALATLRLTRLVVRDTFPPVEAARDAVVRRFGKGSSTAELVSCPYCASFWSALAVMALDRMGKPGRTLTGALALSGVVAVAWPRLCWDSEKAEASVNGDGSFGWPAERMGSF